MKKKIIPTELHAILQRAMDISGEPLADIGIDESIFNVDLDALASVPVRALPPITPACSKTVKISIRIQSGALAAIRHRARVLGVPYQRLINQLLKDSFAGLSPL